MTAPNWKRHRIRSEFILNKPSLPLTSGKQQSVAEWRTSLLVEAEEGKHGKWILYKWHLPTECRPEDAAVHCANRGPSAFARGKQQNVVPTRTRAVGWGWAGEPTGAARECLCCSDLQKVIGKAQNVRMTSEN